MTHYEDLSPYEYFPPSIPDQVRALNIGWLDGGVEYVNGDVPENFLQSLGILTRDAAQMRARGWHACPFFHESGKKEYPVVVDVAGSRVNLGGAEIRVVAATGEWLIAPDLILHYVVAHGYRPPDSFIEAVAASRVAPDPFK